MKIAVVGLGYVGLPLAVEFGKKFEVFGLDLSESKIENYRRFMDPTNEVSSADLQAASYLKVSTDPKGLSEADYIIVAVPTPVDKANQPDFSPLVSSSTTVGRYMKRGAIVIYESTVYPGATEDICIPVLEKESSMEWKKDFHVGYSPERVNPGDKERTITKITKVVSGDDADTLEKVAHLYEAVIQAGVHRATSIRVAEAAKVIENTQRDLNIALMNELSIIFGKMGIDTLDVLRAAETKWNFLPFRPGLVGGHCIGVDPYYLTHRAEMLGYHPQVILAGRRINDGMASYVAKQTIKQIIHTDSVIKGAKVVILGLTFKENCPDLRNSKVANLINELRDFGCEVSVHDPLAEAEEARYEYGITLTPWDKLPRNAEAVVVAVKHKEYMQMPLPEITSFIKKGGVFVDIKSAFDASAVRAAGFRLWRM